MVRDGYYYAIPLLMAALLIGWLASPLWAVPACLLAAFCLWFFRDPERMVPETPGAIVSPGDGKVTDVTSVLFNGAEHLRISIFLNVFNVHVNRSPIGGRDSRCALQEGQVSECDGSPFRQRERTEHCDGGGRRPYVSSSARSRA